MPSTNDPFVLKKSSAECRMQEQLDRHEVMIAKLTADLESERKQHTEEIARLRQDHSNELATLRKELMDVISAQSQAMRAHMLAAPRPGP
jgi:Skp family chaperone for outer membrane proteins